MGTGDSFICEIIIQPCIIVKFTTEPGVPYSVSIAAVNRAGLGEISTGIFFTQQLGKLLSLNTRLYTS